MSERGTLLIISGPSGGGKGAVCRELIRRNGFELSVSATTRGMRPEDKDGVTYHFISEERFKEMIANNELAEWTNYQSVYYGTPDAPLQKALAEGRTMILEIEVEGATRIRNRYPDDCVTVMLLPPDAKEQRARLEKRGTESPEKIAGRLHRAKEELPFLPTYDFVVVNEDGKIEESAEQIEDILKVTSLLSRKHLHMVEDYFKE